MNDRSSTYLTPALARWRSLTDWPLMVVAIGSMPFLLLELERDSMQQLDQQIINAVNWFVLAAFALDYVVELALARNRPSFIRHEWSSLLIVVAQVLALIPFLAPLGALRALRAARLFRIIAVVGRAVAIGGNAASGGRTLLRQHAAAFALGLAGFTWLMSAAAFDIAEGGSDRVHSIADSLWWSAATITTVGYGDVYPTTPAGRLIGGFTMVVGISTFALVTAKVAQFLVRSD